MKTLFATIIVMITTSLFSQNYNTKWSEPDPSHYFYLNGSFDVNMAFGLKDSQRTRNFNDRGFDWDLEGGIRVDHVGIFAYYGRFNEMNYKNYGAGVDYYVNWLSGINVDLSVGGSYSPAKQRDALGRWEGVGMISFRGVVTWWVLDNVGLTGRATIQERSDVSDGWIFEGSVGITIKQNRK